MIIPARYASRCPHCGNQIQIGQEIDWHKGAKAIHVDCLRKIEVAEKKAVQHDYPAAWNKQPGIDYPVEPRSSTAKKKITPPLVDDDIPFVFVGYSILTIITSAHETNETMLQMFPYLFS
ncbi:MAG TPA: hypothetical protein VI522_02255 [Gammaproteobacteria bacterium]|nr:hypothetical protein [Gammaproteobacteria bacterium]